MTLTRGVAVVAAATADATACQLFCQCRQELLIRTSQISTEDERMLRQHTSIPCSARMRKFCCLQAVHQMHSRGFCHADLKNSNAMVTHSQCQVTVKLIDMACSQQQRPGESEQSCMLINAQSASLANLVCTRLVLLQSLLIAHYVCHTQKGHK